MKYPQLPEGVAYKFYPQPDATICILYKARGPHSNKMPDSTNSLVPLAVGISHLKPGETWNPEKGEVASLGRALKMYNNLCLEQPVLRIFTTQSGGIGIR